MCKGDVDVVFVMELFWNYTTGLPRTTYLPCYFTTRELCFVGAIRGLNCLGNLLSNLSFSSGGGRAGVFGTIVSILSNVVRSVSNLNRSISLLTRRISRVSRSLTSIRRCLRSRSCYSYYSSSRRSSRCYVSYPGYNRRFIISTSAISRNNMRYPSYNRCLRLNFIPSSRRRSTPARRWFGVVYGVVPWTLYTYNVFLYYVLYTGGDVHHAYFQYNKFLPYILRLLFWTIFGDFSYF